MVTRCSGVSTKAFLLPWLARMLKRHPWAHSSYTKHLRGFEVTEPGVDPNPSNMHKLGWRYRVITSSSAINCCSCRSMPRLTFAATSATRSSPSLLASFFCFLLCLTSSFSRTSESDSSNLHATLIRSFARRLGSIRLLYLVLTLRLTNVEDLHGRHKHMPPSQAS